MKLVTLFALTALSAFAADQKSVPKADRPAPGAEYPLKTCIVSDEPLDTDFATYTHREPGKPDVTVRLCCEGCIEDFRANPPKFLKKLEAAQAAAKTKAPAKKKS